MWWNWTEAPCIERRGIWTWGYVIYDYERFIDNMARLKMNTLTIWNDCPPENCSDVIEYAHARGVETVLGFHWGWGLPSFSLASREDRDAMRKQVVANYETNYRHLDLDGIYFQTLTETPERFHRRGICGITGLHADERDCRRHPLHHSRSAHPVRPARDVDRRELR